MALRRLEPCAGKLASTVLRGPTFSNESGLLDKTTEFNEEINVNKLYTKR